MSHTDALRDLLVSIWERLGNTKSRASKKNDVMLLSSVPTYETTRPDSQGEGPMLRCDWCELGMKDGDEAECVVVTLEAVNGLPYCHPVRLERQGEETTCTNIHARAANTECPPPELIRGGFFFRIKPPKDCQFTKYVWTLHLYRYGGNNHFVAGSRFDGVKRDLIIEEERKDWTWLGTSGRGTYREEALGLKETADLCLKHVTELGSEFKDVVYRMELAQITTPTKIGFHFLPILILPSPVGGEDYPYSPESIVREDGVVNTVAGFIAERWRKDQQGTST